ncbi:hypothetical protein ACFPL7_24105 [Dongia soli]|uniref:TnsA endonuclease N-terminal domain-containing protein n=1 Tax=Dongia soli TaxID=600628 RepID=A0ABU5EG62_9PROT|nr:hypothetical protein [Dongia soli]MDY0885388.1 hypothetical protein [Dongia soli]
MKLIELKSRLVNAQAFIVEADDGGPIRTIINGRHTKPTGTFLSRKCGRPMPWEAAEEAAQFLFSEFDTSVMSWVAQAHRLEIFRHGKHYQYIADHRRNMTSVSAHPVEIIELKKYEQEFTRDPAYAEKLRLAEEVYTSLGWAFIRKTRQDLFTREHLLLERMAQYRHSRVSAFERALVLQLLDANGGRAPFGDFVEALKFEPRALAILSRLMVDRFLHVDTSRPLSKDTIISKLFA